MTKPRSPYGPMKERRAKSKTIPIVIVKPRRKLPEIPADLRKLEADFMRGIRLGMAWEDHFDQPTLAITRLGDEGP